MSDSDIEFIQRDLQAFEALVNDLAAAPIARKAAMVAVAALRFLAAN